MSSITASLMNSVLLYALSAWLEVPAVTNCGASDKVSINATQARAPSQVSRAARLTMNRADGAIVYCGDILKKRQ
jgi:hypothetical protein